MFSIKSLWNYITGNYDALIRNVERKIADLEYRKAEDPSQEEYCNNLINHLMSEIDELNRKIEEKSKRN